VESGQCLGHLPKAIREVIPLLGERSQPTAVGHAPHDDHVIDGLPVHSHFSDTEIDIGGQSSIESHLASAIGLAGFRLPKIQKLEVDGLPQLVDSIIEEEQHGDVRLDGGGRQCHRGRRMGDRIRAPGTGRRTVVRSMVADRDRGTAT
jgi:hypothetical protein